MLNHIIDPNILLVPQKRVAIAVSNAFGPFGWAQPRSLFKGNVFEEIINNPITIVTEPFVALDREVIQPIYREVIQPVGHALEKVGQGIAKDPITFIAQAAAVAAAPFTGGLSLWALPVIAAASTAAHGGSFEQILTATAISAATAAIGGGFGPGTGLNSLIMNGMSTATAVGPGFAIAGQSISFGTAQAIAAAGTGLAMGAVQATGAAVQGKDPFQAALPSLVGTALGFAGNQLAQADFFQPITSTLNDISTNVSPIVSKAMTGVASAMITGAVTGKDMTQVAIAGLANTAISGLVSSSNFVADFFRNDSGGITNMGAATQSIVADLLGSVAATMASGGKLGTAMGAQFLANATRTLTPFLNPEFDAMATNVQLTYKDAEGKVKAVNDAAIAQQGLVDKYNANADKLNSLGTEVNELLTQRDSVYARYNAATTQGEVDSLKAQFNSLESQIAAKTNEYNSIYDEMDDINLSYLDSVKATEAAQQAYFEVSKSLGSLGTQLSEQLNTISKELTTTAAKQIDPDFNPDQYKEINNLGPGIDPAVHYMSVGKDSGLFTNKEAVETQRDLLLDKATIQSFRANGWNITDVPKDMYDQARDRIGNFYGYNMVGLQNFTPALLAEQSKMPVTWYAPMWDEDTKTLSEAKVLFNGEDIGKVVITDTTLPKGMSVATFYDIYNGNADLTRGTDGNFYWTTNTGSTARIRDAQTGEMVTGNYGAYFNAESVPAGARDVIRDAQGNVVSYKSMDGILHVSLAGTGPQYDENGVALGEDGSVNINVTANRSAYAGDSGTKFDDIDPYQQVEIFHSVDSNILSQYAPNLLDTKKAIDDVIGIAEVRAKELLGKAELTAKEIMQANPGLLKLAGTVYGAAPEYLKAFNGLSVYKDLDPSSTSLYKFADGIEKMAMSMMPKDYQAAAENLKTSIEAIKKDTSKDWTDVAAKWWDNFSKDPDVVINELGVKELIQEIPDLLLAKGASMLVPGGWAKLAGYAAYVTSDVLQSTGDSASGSYAETKKTLTELVQAGKLNMTTEQIHQEALDVAKYSGAIGGGVTTLMNKLGLSYLPDAMEKYVRGKLTGLVSDAITGGQAVLKEVVGENFEELAHAAYLEYKLAQYDPNRDWKKEFADISIQTTAGAGTVAGTITIGAPTVAQTVDLIQATTLRANDAFESAVNSSNIYTVGELGAVMKQWNVPPSVSMVMLPDIIESNPALLNAYSTPAELETVLKNAFGFDAVQSAVIANTKFDQQVTTAQEAREQLYNAGLTNVTEQDAINAGIVGTATADQATKAAEYVNQQMVSEAELRAAAAQENYDITADDLKRLVGRGVQADVIAKFLAEIDPKAVTTAEATQYFKDLGYTKARAEDIAQFVKSAPEEQMKQAVAEWVNPRQVTRQEALDFFTQYGYLPSEAEITRYIVQGPEVFQDAIKTQIGEYVDPRMVDAQEVRDIFKNTLGLNAPVAASDIARLSGQYAESELAAKAKEALPVVSANALFAMLNGDSVINQNVKDEILAKIEQYRNLGKSEAEAQTLATQAVAAQLGTTRADLLTALGATESNLMVKLTNVESTLSDKIDLYRNEGLTQAEATKKALDEMSTQLGTTKENLLAQLGATEENLYLKISDTRTALEAAIADAKATGLKGDELLQKAIDTVSTNLGTTKEDLLAKLGTTESALKTEFTLQLSDTKTALEAAIADAKNAGLQGDAILQSAINKVAGDLGTTKADLLTQLNTSEAALKTEFASQLGAVQTQVSTDIEATRKAIMDQAAAYQKANIDADTALNLAIAGVAQDLGTTRADLQTKLGTTETNLKTELSATKTELSNQIQDVAALLGKPASQVTQADIQLVQNMVGGTAATNLAYDVNKDGKVDNTDLTLIQQQQQIEQNTGITQQTDPNTGLTTYIDTATGQPITGFSPAAGSPWASTGIYSVLDQQKAQQAATAKAQAASAKQAQQKQNFSQMMQMVLGAPDAAGQKVEVKTPDPARINYMYDWSSIFATPQQAGLMPSPYGAMNTYGQPAQGQGGLGSLQTGFGGQAANQSQYKMAIGGYAEGGMINNDISVGDGGNVDDLLNILKGNSG